MTKGDFGVIVKILRGAYPGKIFFDEENNQISTYYDFLKFYTAKDVCVVVKRWIASEGKPPAISDLLGLLSRTLTVKEQIQLDAE